MAGRLLKAGKREAVTHQGVGIGMVVVSTSAQIAPLRARVFSIDLVFKPLDPRIRVASRKRFAVLIERRFQFAANSGLIG